VNTGWEKNGFIMERLHVTERVSGMYNAPHVPWVLTEHSSFLRLLRIFHAPICRLLKILPSKLISLLQ
jgi:hypothetical protein